MFGRRSLDGLLVHQLACLFATVHTACCYLQPFIWWLFINLDRFQNTYETFQKPFNQLRILRIFTSKKQLGASVTKKEKIKCLALAAATTSTTSLLQLRAGRRGNLAVDTQRNLTKTLKNPSFTFQPMGVVLVFLPERNYVEK